MTRLNIHAIDPKIKAQTALQVCAIINEKYSDNSVIVALGDIIAAKANALIEGAGPHYNKEMTRKIRDLDSKRDSMFSMIYNFIESYSKRDIYPENYEIGRTLIENIAPDGLAFLNGPDLLESTLIEKALLILKDEKYKSFLADNYIFPLVGKLETLNNNFMDVHQGRIESKSEKPKPMKQYDKVLNSSIYALMYHVYSIELEEEKMNNLFRPLNEATKRQKPTPPTE
jgi:Family of unknown function (DUF6261)